MSEKNPLVNLNVEYTIDHQIEQTTNTRFLGMTTQHIIQSEQFTVDTI